MLQLHPAAAFLSPLARVLVQPVQVGLLRRSLGDERGHGLCYFSTFYTTLVKKFQQPNRASELRRTLLPRTRVNKGKKRGRSPARP